MEHAIGVTARQCETTLSQQFSLSIHLIAQVFSLQPAPSQKKIKKVRSRLLAAEKVRASET